MTASKDLASIAQDGIREIVETNKIQQQEANRRANVAMFIFVIAFILFVISQVFLADYQQKQLKVQLESLSPSVALLTAELPVRNPIVCPGDTLNYLLTIEVDAPTIVDIDAVVRSNETNLTVLAAPTLRTIYDQSGTIVIQSSWGIPDKLSPVATFPEQLWRAGDYRRVVSVMSTEGDRAASFVSIPFRIGRSCDNIVK